MRGLAAIFVILVGARPEIPGQVSHDLEKNQPAKKRPSPVDSLSATEDWRTAAMRLEPIGSHMIRSA